MENSEHSQQGDIPVPATARIEQQLIEDEMRQSYLDYAMSVIVGRALPDVRDGLKPVHRRILYAMHDLGMTHSKPFRKSARIVGEVIGKYHPHGDTAVYDTIVRMAQDFSLRYQLIDGQGNFGSIDGDNAAAMRYTEARLTVFAEGLLEDIDKETVDFRPNFDETLKEPIVIPSKTPNLLVNGSVGIAVGMATNIPPHNMREVCNAAIHLVDNPKADVMELMEDVSGPDFPTGGLIHGRSGILQAYRTGRGRVIVRGKTHIDEDAQRTTIIIDEIPYQVSKAALIEQIAGLVKEKVIQGISDIRDESDREGMRVVIELKRDAQSQVVLNQLYKHTRFQTTFGIIMLALVNNVPKVLNLKEMLEQFIMHRVEVVTRRTQFELNKAQQRAHILLGLKKAIDSLDQAISIIRGAREPALAKQQLITSFSLDEIQAQAILDMRLQRLTGMEREKIVQEHKDLQVRIADLKDILERRERVMSIIRSELTEAMNAYDGQRRTEIVDAADDIEIEDLIDDEDVVITVSRSGYCKRISLDTYRAQNRGGRGVIGAGTRTDDMVEQMFITNSKSSVLCFTSEGQVHWLKAYQIPEGSRMAQGRHIRNLIPLGDDEHVTTFFPVREFTDDHYLLFATKNGTIKKSALSDYSRPRAGGIRAIVLDEGDRLINVVLTDGESQIMLATRNGMAVKFNEGDARPMGRVSRGVRGISLEAGDEVVSMIVCHDDKTALTITEQGYGKRTQISEYRLINRGGKGVINIQTTERNGGVVGVREVEDEDGLLMISRKGIIIRTRADQISVIGRNTQGVRIMRLDADDVVASISKVQNGESVDIGDDNENPPGDEGKEEVIESMDSSSAPSTPSERTDI